MSVTDLLARLSHGPLTGDEARQQLGLPPVFCDWPLNLPPATRWQAPGPDGPGGLLLPCSYCKAPKGPGNCKNCGAPQ